MTKLTKETSPFKAGVAVARISVPHWSGASRRISKKVVDKVWKDGRFTLANSEAVVYTPRASRDRIDGTSKEYSREHVELWTPEIEAEIANQKAREEMEMVLRKVSEKALDLSPVADANKIRLLHTILGYDEARCIDIIVKDTYGN